MRTLTQSRHDPPETGPVIGERLRSATMRVWIDQDWLVSLGDAPDRDVRPADRRDGCFDLWHCPIGGLGDIDRGARQAAERVGAVLGVLFHPGDHLGMRGLHDQRSNAAHERGDVTNDLP